MASNHSVRDIAVICPFYHKQLQDSNREIFSITCDPLFENSLTIVSFFPNKREKNEHMNNFCKCKCWQGCKIAKVLQDDIED